MPKAAKQQPNTSLIDTDPVAFLTSNASDFWASVWEQRPFVYRSNDDKVSFFRGLCNFDALLDVSSTAEAVEDAMQWGVDVNAARYIDGTRETLNGDQDIHTAELQHLYTDLGCTLQVHQPQRWDGTIHRIVAALEAQLGCLIGCNSYITPPGTQGLAPHYDDVDVFVCQTHGAKRWAVYASEVGGPAGPLTTKSSPDLDAEDLPDAPLLDVVLQVGDVLYMPRGTVHQARALEGDKGVQKNKQAKGKGKQQKKKHKGDGSGQQEDKGGNGQQGSSHLTLSAYQRWNYATLTTTLLQCMMDNVTMGMAPTPMVLPMALRKGLPVGFVYEAGMQASLQALPAKTATTNTPAAPNTPNINNKQRATKRPRGNDTPTAKTTSTAKAASNAAASHSRGAAHAATALAAGLRALADTVEAAPGLLDVAADAMAFEFWRHRAPPHPQQLDHEEMGPSPESANVVVAPVAPPSFQLTRLVPCPHPEAGGPPCVRLLSCLGNDVSRHMMGGADHDHGHEEEEEEEEGIDMLRGMEEGMAVDGQSSDEGDDDKDEAADDAPPSLVAVAQPSNADGADEDNTDASDEDDASDGSFDSEDEDMEGGDLVFEPRHVQPLQQLLGGGPVRVGDVRIPGVVKELAGEAAVELAGALWNERVIASVK